MLGCPLQPKFGRIEKHLDVPSQLTGIRIDGCLLTSSATTPGDMLGMLELPHSRGIQGARVGSCEYCATLGEPSTCRHFHPEPV
jgi:hypothetical protein